MRKSRRQHDDVTTSADLTVTALAGYVRVESSYVEQSELCSICAGYVSLSTCAYTPRHMYFISDSALYYLDNTLFTVRRGATLRIAPRCTSMHTHKHIHTHTSLDHSSSFSGTLLYSSPSSFVHSFILTCPPTPLLFAPLHTVVPRLVSCFLLHQVAHVVPLSRI